MDLKIKVICLVFVCNMLTMSHAPAFFQHNEKSDNLRIENTPNDQSTQDNNLLYLYDNFFSRASEDYFTKKRGDFIFADQIKIHIPMNIMIQESIYPENSIDRMMGANLRAKKLYDEYTELQKKVRSLQKEDAIQDQKKNEKKKEGSLDAQIDIEEKNESIQKTMSHVSFLGQAPKELEPEQNPIIFEQQSPVNSEISTPQKNVIDHVSSEKFDNEKGGEVDTGQQHLLRKESRELPWVLNVLLRLLNYIVKNRLEIMLYMVFTAMIVFLISLKLKK